ncbi:serine protease 55-like [Mixophyes fleayi]|uniref:serine protease 55-like n=1 Tax=Mixophyes fleayi TaxID=3061075 RepID=UPI003F4DA98F
MCRMSPHAVLKTWRQGHIIDSWTVPLLLLCLLGGRGTILGAGTKVTCGFREDFDQQKGSRNTATLIESRIIGGTDSMTGEWPWAVSLQRNDGHFCGGSIISHWWILSASHCFLNSSTHNLKVLAGHTTLDETAPFMVVKKIILHPQYSKRNGDNDIALLLLLSALHFNKMTAPICLPPPASYNPSTWKTCYVTGWGTTDPGTIYTAPTLKKVKLLLFSFKQCMAWMFSVTHNMFCAGISEGGKDACQGDSGGPLVCRNSTHKTWYQIGIVSWGEGCGKPMKPGVYAVVSNYIEWIQSVTAAEGRPFDVIYPDTWSVGKEPNVNDELEYRKVIYSSGPGKNLIYYVLFALSLGLVMLIS